MHHTSQTSVASLANSLGHVGVADPDRVGVGGALTDDRRHQYRQGDARHQQIEIHLGMRDHFRSLGGEVGQVVGAGDPLGHPNGSRIDAEMGKHPITNPAPAAEGGPVGRLDVFTPRQWGRERRGSRVRHRSQISAMGRPERSIDKLRVPPDVPSTWWNLIPA